MDIDLVEGLWLSPRAERELLADYHAPGRAERCGVLLGELRDGTARAVRALALQNASASPHRFSIASQELRRARATARDLGLVVVAVYHTHLCHSPELSDEDRVGLRRSGVPWLIVGTPGPSLAAYLPPDGAQLPIRSDMAQQGGCAG